MTKEQSAQRIGQRIADLRKQQGLTQQELADVSNIGRSHLVRIEQGKYNVRLDTIASIAQALGCEVSITPIKHIKQ